MEYTKDIILTMDTKEKNINERTSSFIRKNKFIISLLSITVIFMACDFALINTFIKLLTKI